MAIQLTDSFDSYAAVADLLKQYGSYYTTIPPVYSTTAGKFGAGSISMPNGSNGGGGVYVFIASRGQTFNGSTAIGAAFWFKSTGLPTNGLYAACGVANSAGGALFGVGPYPATGVMAFVRGFNSGSQGSGTINVCDGNWHWIEVIWNKSGTCKCWVDGVLDVLSSNTAVFATADVPDNFRLLGPESGSGISWRYDDLIVCDDIGGKTTPANFPLGPSRIATKRPSSDSSVTFANSTGANHFGQVNEAVGSNTQNVQGTVSGQKDLYGYTALGFSPSRITAAVLKSYVENPGAGSMQFKNACKSNLTETDSAAITAPPAAQIISTEYNVDPNTAAAWTQTGLDAATFGAVVV